MSEDSREEMSEDDALEIVLADHPDWAEDYNEGTLPREITGEDGEPMNPHMHIMIHVIVERQLAADDPPGVVAVADELAKRGVSAHDTRHEIGMAAAEQVFDAIEGKTPAGDAKYLADLREIVKSY
jgi:hypothetical protein